MTAVETLRAPATPSSTSSTSSTSDNDIHVLAPHNDDHSEILTPGALRFLAALARRFEGRRRSVLRARELRQYEINNGWLPSFPLETRWVRENEWTVAPIPADLLDRRVEIAGPVDRESVSNALQSGACVYMADFEDSHSPSWHSTLRGHANLRHAIHGTMSLPARAGVRAIGGTTIAMRPRGWHLLEKHVTVDGCSISASLFDAGLFLFHNAKRLVKNGSGPYLYLPKLESYFEARLWNDVFNFAQERLGLPRGTIRATVIIETILAAFQMDEILYELREHAGGLRHGRWDYIFSFIKKFRNRPDFILPDRNSITMDHRFLKASANLMVSTCHRRGIHAIGGKATQDPAHCDPHAKQQVFEDVVQNMLREAEAGHDGTQVVHPGLVSIAKGVFDARIRAPHQIDHMPTDLKVTSADLLAVPTGPRTLAGLRNNVRIAITYLYAWLRGRGTIEHDDVIENAGTAEISRSQVWQWVHHKVTLDDGTPVTSELVASITLEELERLQESVPHDDRGDGRSVQAAQLATGLMTSPNFAEFMTTIAYEHLD